MSSCIVVCCLHHQIAALGYVSPTSHITAIRYFAPITAFANDVMKSGELCINQKYLAHLISVMVCSLARASSINVGKLKIHI